MNEQKSDRAAVDGSLTIADSSTFDNLMTTTSVANNRVQAGNSITSWTFQLAPNSLYVVHAFRKSAINDHLTAISSNTFSPAISTFTPIAPTAAPSVSNTGQNWDTNLDYQWAYYFTTGNTPATGTGSITVSFSLASTFSTVIDVTQIQGANLVSPLAQASNTATGNASAATANLGLAVLSTLDTKLALIGSNGSAAFTSTTLTSLFSSAANANGTAAAFYNTNPITQADSITPTNIPQWGTLTLELAHN